MTWTQELLLLINSIGLFSLAVFVFARLRTIRHRVNDAAKGLTETFELRLERLLVAEQSIQGLETKMDQIAELVQAQEKVADHLLGEQLNLCMLPRHHPLRTELLQELTERMAPILAELSPILFPNQIELDEWDWMYRQSERAFPYSVTFEEGMILFHLVRANQLCSGYEIATAFGFSSCFIALAMKANGGHLLSMDAYIEESQEDFLYDLESTRQHVQEIRGYLQSNDTENWPVGLSRAKRFSDTLQVNDVVDFCVGCSPDDVPATLENRKLDFAFIDGGHFGEQPVVDFEAVLPFLDPNRFLVLFHDTQGEAVAKGVHHAASRLGCKPFSIHTRNRIVAISRGLDEAVLQQCRDITARQYV